MLTRRPFASIPLALLFVVAGVGHFTNADEFAAIVPAFLPWPHLITYVTGVMEIALGVGLLAERSRRASGLLTAAFLVAVFPANINMAVNRITVLGMPDDSLYLYGRLPLQAVLIGWALWVARPVAAAVDPEG
jgi:uncharacterized membrane protein